MEASQKNGEVPGHNRLSSGIWVPKQEVVLDRLKAYEPKPRKRYAPRDGELSLFKYCLDDRHPLMIVGPPGTAKTLFVSTMAKLYDLPYMRVPFAKGVTLASQVGSVNLYTTENGAIHMVSDDGPVVTAARAPNGAVLYCDEIRKASGDQLAFYFSLTDEERKIVVPETKETIELHPRLIVVASYNPGVLFSASELEPALARRFITQRFDYLENGQSEKRIMEDLKRRNGGTTDDVVLDELYWKSLHNRLHEEEAKMARRAQNIKDKKLEAKIVGKIVENVSAIREKAEKGEITLKEQPADSVIDTAVDMIIRGFDYSTALLTAIINPILSDIDPEWKASSAAMKTVLEAALPKID